jgi:hypothetical protein
MLKIQEVKMSQLPIRHLAAIVTAGLIAACGSTPAASPSPTPAPATPAAQAAAPVAQGKPRFIEFYADW